MSTNEIKLNGVTIMSVREDSVSEKNLLLNETATNSAGEKIKGELDPVTEEELDEVKEQLNELSDDVYKVSDEEGEIEETDYIPFNDISDVNKPKKKALLSSIIDKIKSAFLPTKWGHVELIQNSDVLSIKDKEIDATESDNGITAIHYPSSNAIVDNNSRILSRYEAVVKPNGDIYAKMYARNYDTNGNAVGSNSIEAGVDKSGNNFYYVADPDKFRKAINTIDQMGTRIPANSDLNDYKTAGTYYVENNTDAGTISNMPLGVAYSGKLIVLDMDSNVRVDQLYISNFNGTGDLVHIYVRQIDNNGVARPWREVTEPHTYEVGTSIPSNADLNDYTTAGVYKIAPTSIASTISNMPVEKAGKLVVLSGISNNEDWFLQMYYDHEGIIYVRRRNNSSASAWSEWKQFATTDDISPANVGNGYAEATVSGSAITATITGFKLRAGVIVAIRIVPDITSACTLNINNTGAKSVKFWSNEDVSFGKVIGGARITTFIYDGTYYRVISIDRTPYVGNQSYVADTSGNVVIDWGYGSNRAQIKYNVGANKLLWNYYKNSIWRGDVTLADYDDLVTQLGIKIPQNTNINTYTTQGVFYVEANVDASTMTNLPVSLAGKLIVLRLSPNANYKTQLFTPWNSSEIWSRNTTNGGTNWTSWVEYANTNQLGASIAKVGKSILPSWSYTSNTITSNGITFTFNPSTGEITANGTATANADCRLAGVDVSYYWLGKGTYVLSGCPSGGSSSKYYICLNLANNDKFDYGSGNSFTLTTEYESVNNEHFYIRIISGQTVSNLVFKPMLRPAFTTADFEPCEDIHKGNCYVGTCTTAGGTKDKVAYVDGYFVLRKGVRVAIKFSNNNTYSNVTSSPITLNVNGTGAKNIWYNTTHSGAGNTGTYTTPYGVAGRYNFYIYDGTYWVWDSKGNDDNSTYSNQSLGNGYGTCATAEATTAKVVTLSGYNLTINGYVSVKFTNAVPANATMNINSKGAKNIWYRGANITANVIKAGDLATFIYDGTRYHLVGIDRHCRSVDISSSVTVGCASFSTGATYVKREGDKCVVNFERTLTADYALTGYSTNILSGLPIIKNTNYWKTAIPMFVVKNSAVTNVIPVQCHGNPTVLQTEGVNITIPSGSRISFSFEYYCNP